MLSPRLLVFDFDGVIVDGMNEYWWSARRAFLRLNPTVDLSESIPPQFRQLRPWIHHGWEMVLIAALISEQRGPLEQLGVQAFVHDYAAHCTAALERFGWDPVLLQQTLEAVRADAVRTDRDSWLALHQPYPGVPERLTAFSEENMAWAVLTTKARDFTAELLASMGLKPERLDGHESGSKPEVLRRLACDWKLDGFGTRTSGTGHGTGTGGTGTGKNENFGQPPKIKKSPKIHPKSKNNIPPPSKIKE